MTSRRRQRLTMVVAVAYFCNVSRALRMVDESSRLFDEEDVVLPKQNTVVYGESDRRQDHGAARERTKPSSVHNDAKAEHHHDLSENETEPITIDSDAPDREAPDNSGEALDETRTDNAASAEPDAEQAVKGDPRPVSEQVKAYYDAQAGETEKASGEDDSDRATASDDMEADERIHSSDDDQEQLVVARRDALPVSEQVEAPQARGSTTPNSVSDDTDSATTNDDVGDIADSKQEAADDDKIQSSGEDDLVPTVRRDPRPVSEQVKAYYEYMASRDSNTISAESDAGSKINSRLDTKEAEPDFLVASGQNGDDVVTDELEVTDEIPTTSTETGPTATDKVDDRITETVDSVSNTDSGNVGASERIESGSVPNGTESVDGTSQELESQSDDMRQDGSTSDTRSKIEPQSSEGTISSDTQPDEADTRPVDDGTIDESTVDDLPAQDDKQSDDEVLPKLSNSMEAKLDNRINKTTTEADETNVLEVETSGDTTDSSPIDGPENDETVSGEPDSEMRARAVIDEDVIDFDVFEERDASTDKPETPKESNNDNESTANQEAPHVNNTLDLEARAEANAGDDVIDSDLLDTESSDGVESELPVDISETEEEAFPTEDTDTLETENEVFPSDDVGVQREAVTHDDTSNDSEPVEGSAGEPKQEAIDPDGTGPPDKLTIPWNESEKMGHSDEEEEAFTFDEQAAVVDGPQGSGWGFGTQKAPSNTAVPEHLVKPLGSIDDSGGADPLKEDNVQVPDDESRPQGGGERDARPAHVDESQGSSMRDHVESNRRESEQWSDIDTVADHDESSSLQSETKSVNSEFVDGLDDIHKFFQSVDPPDELDVGAVGSSMQEVLVGQSIRIVLKRVKVGFSFVKRKISKLKTKVDEHVSRRTTQEGEFALITREDVKTVVDKVKKLGKRAIKGVKDLLDDLFENDDWDDDLFEMDGIEQVRSKIASLRREQYVPPRQMDSREE